MSSSPQDQDGDSSMTATSGAESGEVTSELSTDEALSSLMPVQGADILDEFLAPTGDPPRAERRKPAAEVRPKKKGLVDIEGAEILDDFRAPTVEFSRDGKPFVKKASRELGAATREYTADDERIGKIQRGIYTMIQCIHSRAAFKTAMSTLRKIVSNIHNDPANDKFRRLRLNNEALVKRLFQFDGSLSVVTHLGFRKEETDDDSGSDQWVAMKQSAYEKGIFQLTLNAIDRAKFLEKAKAIPKVDRRLRVYRKEDLDRYRAAHTRLADANDDEDWGVTEMGSDSSSALSSASGSRLGSKSERSESALRMAAVRDTRKRAKLKNPSKLMSVEKHKEILGLKQREFAATVIQVEFETGLTLEGHFHPRESVAQLFAFVTEALQREIVAHSFTLLLPPRVELKDASKSLREMGMIPAAKVRFKSSINNGCVATAPRYAGLYLKRELTEALTSDFSHMERAVAEEKKEDVSTSASAPPKKKKKKRDRAALSKMFKLGGR